MSKQVELEFDVGLLVLDLVGRGVVRTNYRGEPGEGCVTVVTQKCSGFSYRKIMFLAF